MPSTERLDLSVPTVDDLDELHVIFSDPQVWRHYPSLRHTTFDQTRAMLEGWLDGWDTAGLGPWTVRESDTPTVVGYGGVDLRADAFWNLGYRLSTAVHGRGYATEISLAAMSAANAHRPHLPIAAYMLDNNPASVRVAEKVGLALRHQAPDAGNPDPHAIRLVYADRELTDDELAAVLS